MSLWDRFHIHWYLGNKLRIPNKSVCTKQNGFLPRGPNTYTLNWVQGGESDNHVQKEGIHLSAVKHWKWLPGLQAEFLQSNAHLCNCSGTSISTQINSKSACSKQNLCLSHITVPTHATSFRHLPASCWHLRTQRLTLPLPLVLLLFFLFNL